MEVGEGRGVTAGSGAAVGGDVLAGAGLVVGTVALVPTGVDVDDVTGVGTGVGRAGLAHAAISTATAAIRTGLPNRLRARIPPAPYPIVRIRRGFSIVIVSISASETPAARRRGRNVVCRYVYPLPS